MRRTFLAIVAAIAVAPAQAAGNVPAPGCYERVYDAAHLAAHKGQIIDRVWAFVEPEAPNVSMPYGVDLKFSVKGYSKSTFETSGACEKDGDGVVCNAAVSAEERSICRDKRDGVRSCRMDLGESGSFRAASVADGLLITVVERLEVGSSFNTEGYDYLYFSPSNSENRAFLLKPAPMTSCKWDPSAERFKP